MKHDPEFDVEGDVEDHFDQLIHQDLDQFGA